MLAYASVRAVVIVEEMRNTRVVITICNRGINAIILWIESRKLCAKLQYSRVACTIPVGLTMVPTAETSAARKVAHSATQALNSMLVL